MDVLVADEVCIPSRVTDLVSFRRWAQSDAYPEHGRVSYLDGSLWVDLSMEQLFTHNRVKTCYTSVLSPMIDSDELGYFFSDRVRLTHPRANLSTEPDGTFCSFDAIERGRVRFVEGLDEGYTELEGTPEMTLEVVSRYSVRKDTEFLRRLYFRAGILEYWLVDVRKEPIKFDILRRNGRGYTTTPRHKGWVKSKVFNRSFLLETKLDRLGNPQYLLHVEE